MELFGIRHWSTYFFYSKKALQDLSKKYNYKIYFLESGFILMTSDQFNCNKLKIFY